MSELLSGIRVIKYFGWEPYFAQKVFQSREQELKYLKGRKYLDALCVYLWATTPVLISVLTFAIFAILGNQLTAAKGESYDSFDRKSELVIYQSQSEVIKVIFYFYTLKTVKF